jgi:type I site-specific restriction endonuclease
LENSESENRRLKSESDKLRNELSSISNGSLNSTVNDDLVNMLKDSHEMIKKHNQKLETDLAKLKSKYEDEIAQMRASHTQLKTLFMKNNF